MVLTLSYFKETPCRQAYSQANEENQAIIAGLKSTIDDLTKQVEHSRMLIGGMESSEDYIVLGSDEVA